MRGRTTVPSRPRAPSCATCWNCERDADEIVAVTLRTPMGNEATFPLCRHCNTSVYPAVAAVAEDAGIVVNRRDDALLLRQA